MKQPGKKQKTVIFFGNFGTGNFGNECTLRAILDSFRRNVPDVDFLCICTGPENTADEYGIPTVPVSDLIWAAPVLRKYLPIWLRRVVVGVPSEIYRIFKAFAIVRNSEILIVVGTGLLTDVFGLSGWGPYSLFKYSWITKLCGRKLFFVSVGAGPLQTSLGRFLTKSALSAATFRSYRDNSSKEYLESIGFRTNRDPVSPDLVFSLDEDLLRGRSSRKTQRVVVGLGPMGYVGMYAGHDVSRDVYDAYLNSLAVLARWLLSHGYDVRLIIGDIFDTGVLQELKALIGKQETASEEGSLCDQPIFSTEELLSALAETDLVVATRFHNILLSLLLEKPVLSISFHHKCSSLMKDMELSQYCIDINHLDPDDLVARFCDLVGDAAKVKFLIRQKLGVYRKALDVQYNRIFQEMNIGR